MEYWHWTKNKAQVLQLPSARLFHEVIYSLSTETFMWAKTEKHRRQIRFQPVTQALDDKYKVWFYFLK